MHIVWKLSHCSERVYERKHSNNMVIVSTFRTCSVNQYWISPILGLWRYRSEKKNFILHSQNLEQWHYSFLKGNFCDTIYWREIATCFIPQYRVKIMIPLRALLYMSSVQINGHSLAGKFLIISWCLSINFTVLLWYMPLL